MWTDNQIRALKPRETKYRRAENIKQRGVGRLLVEVHPSGAKHFYFQYWRKSKKVMIAIGKYRQSTGAAGVTLSQARDKAREYGRLLQKGVDVESYLEEQERQAEEEHKQRRARKRQGTFDQLLESYLTTMEADGKRSHASVRRSLKAYVQDPFQDLIKRKADEIEADDIRMILSRMLDNGVTTHTNRVRSYLHAAFQHGLKQDNNPRSYLEDGVRFNLKYNPVAFVPKQTDYERVGEHVIPEEQIRIIWKEFKPVPNAELLVKLAFTTGQRLGELVRLRRADINVDDEILIIPGSVSKNGRDHVVPLDDLSLDLVNRALDGSEDCEYLFPGKHGSKKMADIPTSGTTVAKFIRDYCVDNEKVSPFVPRDIRRTVKTLMGKAGIPKDLRDRIQNHAMLDVSAKHYDRYDYLKEKQHGMKVWNQYLELIINPKKNVTPIKRKV